MYIPRIPQQPKKRVEETLPVPEQITDTVPLAAPEVPTYVRPHPTEPLPSPPRQEIPISRPRYSEATGAAMDRFAPEAQPAFVPMEVGGWKKRLLYGLGQGLAGMMQAAANQPQMSEVPMSTLDVVLPGAAQGIAAGMNPTGYQAVNYNRNVYPRYLQQEVEKAKIRKMYMDQAKLESDMYHQGVQDDNTRQQMDERTYDIQSKQAKEPYVAANAKAESEYKLAQAANEAIESEYKRQQVANAQTTGKQLQLNVEKTQGSLPVELQTGRERLKQLQMQNQYYPRVVESQIGLRDAQGNVARTRAASGGKSLTITQDADIYAKDLWENQGRAESFKAWALENKDRINAAIAEAKAEAAQTGETPEDPDAMALRWFKKEEEKYRKAFVDKAKRERMKGYNRPDRSQTINDAFPD